MYIIKLSDCQNLWVLLIQCFNVMYVLIFPFNKVICKVHQLGGEVNQFWHDRGLNLESFTNEIIFCTKIDEKTNFVLYFASSSRMHERNNIFFIFIQVFLATNLFDLFFLVNTKSNAHGMKVKIERTEST